MRKHNEFSRESWKKLVCNALWTRPSLRDVGEERADLDRRSDDYFTYTDLFMVLYILLS